MQPVTLGGRDLHPYYHACAFVRSRDEWYGVIGEFFKQGIDAGEQCLNILNADFRDDHLQDLQRIGIDVRECSQCGQLKVLCWKNVSGGRPLRSRSHAEDARGGVRQLETGRRPTNPHHG